MNEIKLLNIDKLLNNNKTLVDNDINVYKLLIEKIHGKIELRNNNRYTDLTYKIPTIMFGIPLYDYKKIIKLISFSLINNGLYVKKFKINNEIYIYISWSKEHINYNKYSSILLNRNNKLYTKVDTPNINNINNKKKKNKENNKNDKNDNNIGLINYTIYNNIVDSIPINKTKYDKYIKKISNKQK